MEWSEVVSEVIQKVKPVEENDEALKSRIVSLLDYTSLHDQDTEQRIASFVENADTPYGHVAGVCTWPRFIRLVKASCPKEVKTVTVANFPDGSHPLDEVIVEIGRAVEDGCDEIDVVFPYMRYLAGERRYAFDFISACKAACGTGTLLKIILETGALADLSIIADASHDAFIAGADFVKTSTGKNNLGGATLEVAATLLLVIEYTIKDHRKPIGLKVSGGISDIGMAASFIALADEIMGKKWVTPQTFRIGSSKIMDRLLTFA